MQVFGKEHTFPCRLNMWDSPGREGLGPEGRVSYPLSFIFQKLHPLWVTCVPTPNALALQLIAD